MSGGIQRVVPVGSVVYSDKRNAPGEGGVGPEMLSPGVALTYGLGGFLSTRASSPSCDIRTDRTADVEQNPVVE